MMTTPVLRLSAAGKTVFSGVFIEQLYQQRTVSKNPVSTACCISTQSCPVTTDEADESLISRLLRHL